MFSILVLVPWQKQNEEDDVLKVTVLVVAALVTASCLPMGSFFPGHPSAQRPLNEEAQSTLNELPNPLELSNLHEFISHNLPMPDVMVAVMRDEPIRPGVRVFESEPKKKNASVSAKEMVLVVSAYCGVSPLEKNYRKKVKRNGGGKMTSTGTAPKIGTVAADHSKFPPGTVFEIPEYGIGIVEDSGDDIQGNRLDVFMGHGQGAYSKAIQWGKRKVKVRLLHLAKAKTKKDYRN